MALDATSLALSAQEIKKALIDCKVDKVFEPTKEEIILLMRSKNANFRLLLSARSGAARISLTDEKPANPETPPSFCMLLRKHLSGGKLIDVTSIDGERIVFFDFQCTNEMADTVTITVACELMGRYTNIVVFYKNGKIIDALKRIDFEASDIRQILPGLMYTLPPAPSKKSFIKTSANEIANQIKTLNVPVSDAIMRTVAGLGPVVCREIAFRAFGDNTIYADELTSQQTETLINEIEQVQQHATLGENFYLVKNEKGKPCEFSFTKLTQYLPNYQMVEYQSFSELLCDYYNEKDRAERLWQKSKQLIKSVKNIHERCLRKQIARKEELKETKDREKYKIYGELISANIYKIEKGETKTTVLNYYTNKEIEIKLDPRYSPSKNSQKYYKEYKKKQTAAVMLEKLLLQGEKEIEYLETVIDILQRTETDNVLNEIRAELKGQVYLKYYKQKDKKQKPTDFIKYQSVDGYKIFVGRNNLQNDRLTLKTARGKDLWFHTKNAPGSHVVVFSEGQDIPDTTKNQAAQLAVFHSSQTGGSKVCVDFTQVKNIKKTNDLKPGMVIYDNYETAFITQDDEIIKNITKISF